MIAPASIDLMQGDEALRPGHGVLTNGCCQPCACFRYATPDVRNFSTMQNRLPLLHDQASLLFDDGRIFPQRFPDLDVLAFDDALGTSDLAEQDRVVDRLVALIGDEPAGNQPLNPVTNEQFIIEAHEEP